MPGGWTMSMTWMRMPGQTWPGAAASFARHVDRDDGGDDAAVASSRCCGATARPSPDRRTRLGRLTALVGAGYFSVWTLVGLATFPLGVALAAGRDAAPGAGARRPDRGRAGRPDRGRLQFTAWKARHLACCRDSAGRRRSVPATPARPGDTACVSACTAAYCCAGLMAILLVVGVMDVRAMAVVTAAITLERLAPAGERVARAIGAVVVGAGLVLIGARSGRGRDGTSAWRTWTTPTLACARVVEAHHPARIWRRLVEERQSTPACLRGSTRLPPPSASG